MAGNGLLGQSVLHDGDYSPVAETNLLEALLISSGAGMTAAKNDAMLKSMTGASWLNDRFGNPQIQEWIAQQREKAQREMEDMAQLYEPLRQSFPMTSAIGESAPGVLYGLRGLSSQLKFNLGRAMLEQTQNPLLASMAQRLRRY